MATKKKRLSERTEALLEKQREMAERVRRSMQKDRSNERKIRNRALFLIGVAAEQQIKRQPGYAQQILKVVKERLPKPEHQEAVVGYVDALTSDLATQPPPVPMPATPSQPSEGVQNA